MDLNKLSDEELINLHKKEVGEKPLDQMSDAELIAAHQASMTPDSPIETYGKKAVDAISLGYAPQIISGAKNAFTSTDEYIKERDKQRDLIDHNQNPIASGLGTATGIGGSLLIPFGELAQGGKAMAALESSPTLMKIFAKSLAMGEGISALKNPGDEKGKMDPLQLDERGNNMKEDLPMNIGLSGAGSMLSSGLGKMARKAPKYGVDSLLPRGAVYTNDGTWGNSLKEIGDFVNRHGINANAATIETVAQRAHDMEQKIGAKVGELLPSLDPKYGGFDYNDLTKNVMSEYLKRSKNGVGNFDIADNVAQEAQKMAHQINEINGRAADAPLSLSDLNMLKKGLQGKVNYRVPSADAKINATNDLNNEAAKFINHIIGSEIENTPELGEKALKSYKSLNKLYSLSADAKDIATKAQGSMESSAARSNSMIPAGLGFLGGAIAKDPMVGAGIGATALLAQTQVMPRLNSLKANIGSALANHPDAMSLPMKAVQAAQMGMVDPMVAESAIRSDPNLKLTDKAKLINKTRGGQ